MTREVRPEPDEFLTHVGESLALRYGGALLGLSGAADGTAWALRHPPSFPSGVFLVTDRALLDAPTAMLRIPDGARTTTDPDGADRPGGRLAEQMLVARPARQLALPVPPVDGAPHARRVAVCPLSSGDMAGYALGKGYRWTPPALVVETPDGLEPWRRGLCFVLGRTGDGVEPHLAYATRDGDGVRLGAPAPASLAGAPVLAFRRLDDRRRTVEVVGMLAAAEPYSEVIPAHDVVTAVERSA